MNTEHLQRIRARCAELLAIAEKRTQGRWEWETDCLYDDQGRIIVDASCLVGDELEEVKQTSAFIAACAGSAEAGWRATIAAIDAYILDESNSDSRNDLSAVADAIITAWPEELL